MAALEQELMERISQLDAENQRRVLEFVRSLGLPPGIPGDELIARAYQVDFDPAELAAMQQAIEDGCERIEPGEGSVDLFT